MLDVDGASYEPVAYLGSAIVAGTDYLIFFLVTPSSFNDNTHFEVVTDYNHTDTDKAQIIDSQAIEIG